ADRRLLPLLEFRGVPPFSPARETAVDSRCSAKLRAVLQPTEVWAVVPHVGGTLTSLVRVVVVVVLLVVVNAAVFIFIRRCDDIGDRVKLVLQLLVFIP